MSVPAHAAIHYPESDGEPMADNDVQRIIMETLEAGLGRLFYADDVYVSANVFWYPVEGRPDIVVAPDGIVVFDRPRGARRSYKQWEEGGIAPHFVAEIVSRCNDSRSNDAATLIRKQQFYARYGVEEYLLFDPETGMLGAHIRDGPGLALLPETSTWTSPRLGVTFTVEPHPSGAGFDLAATGPDGRRFETPVAGLLRADAEQARADAAQARADAETAALRHRLRQAGLEP